MNVLHRTAIIIFVLFALLFLAVIFECRAQEFLPLQDQLLTEINARRAKRLAKPLAYEAKFQFACDAWAKYLVTSYVHNYTEARLGEVISIDSNPDDIISGFFDSPKHKDILLDRQAKRVCISVYKMPESKRTNKKGEDVFILPLHYVVIRTYH